MITFLIIAACVGLGIYLFTRKKNEVETVVEKAEEKIEIAKAMLLDGNDIEKIAKITGLSVNDIQKLI